MDETIVKSSNDPGSDRDDAVDVAARPVDRDEVRESIILRAKELFAHYGYSKTNIGDIARACTMSPGNLYRYFRNKQAIGHAVVQTFFEEEEARLAPIRRDATLSPEARLRAMISAGVMHTVEHLRQSPKIVELAEMICETEEGVELIREHVTERQGHFAETIAEGVAEGTFRVADPATAARAVQMGVKFFHVPFAIARHGLDQVEDDLAITLDLLCAGLRAG